MISTAEKHTLIYNDILKMSKSQQGTGFPADNLFKGAWGALFYMFYYEQYIDDSLDHAVPLLEELYNKLEITQYSNFTYCNGLSGPFWLLNHLNKHEFIELDIADLASDFITAAIAESNFHLASKNFDFLHGSAGICTLLVSFAQRPDVREHLAHFVASLEAFSVMTPRGRSVPMFYYHTDPPSEIGTDAFSLAHGTCSLQILLARIYKAGVAQEQCKRLIYETMDFVLSYEGKPDENTPIALYPSSLNLDGNPPAPSRISWCYGDVNVAIALWECGHLLKEEKWITRALDILRYSTRRNTLESGAVVDTCLCHGTAGNAAMYRRFWHETNDKIFYQCSEDWYNLTDNLIQFSEQKGEHGIRVWQGKDEQWQYRWDLLDGSAGTGLALISRSVSQHLPWDEFLLIS
ncbi:lanthionine synthetase LanC family protein [Taibaiella koreensis]|uniref:lanthionine synthetase LanC family protein n=1 Tax=Taibaiella koreensis TaxID=1268548 RepID=UPI0013C2A221|nr:lanthionine synthetase LanC family protein [Taibaiella koreensis]